MNESIIKGPFKNINPKANLFPNESCLSTSQELINFFLCFLIWIPATIEEIAIGEVHERIKTKYTIVECFFCFRIQIKHL